MTTMLQDKGAEYVAAWPSAIAKRIGCDAEFVLAALNQTYPDTQVADLDSDHAKVVVGVAKHAWLQHRISRGDRIEDVTHCRGCGLPLRRPYAECEECV